MTARIIVEYPCCLVPSESSRMSFSAELPHFWNGKSGKIRLPSGGAGPLLIKYSPSGQFWNDKIHIHHHLFVDFKSAYDRIKRPNLYEAMREMGIPSKLIRLVKLTMKDVRCQVRIQSDCSDSFPSSKGGDGLACLFFNLTLEKGVWDSGIQTGHTMFTRTVQILRYADDLDIVARTQSKLVEALGNSWMLLQPWGWP